MTNIHLLAEIKVHYAYHLPQDQRIKITGSEDAYQVLVSKWDKDIIELQEEFKVLYLNRNHEVIGTYSLSKGGVSATIADVRIIFATALQCVASALILAHNHPSGNLTPSQADVELTKKVVEAGKLLDIAILDHLILTGEGFYSFAMEGRM